MQPRIYLDWKQKSQ